MIEGRPPTMSLHAFALACCAFFTILGFVLFVTKRQKMKGRRQPGARERA